MPHNRCPVCNAEWPKALRRPFKLIDCPECRAEKQRRIDWVAERSLATLKRESEATVAKVLAMTPPELAALDAKLDAIWGG